MTDPPDPKNDTPIYKYFPTNNNCNDMISLYRYDKIRKKYDKRKVDLKRESSFINDIFISVCIVLLHKMIELEPELMDYKALEKEFESKDLELVGIKYVYDMTLYVVKKLK